MNQEKITIYPVKQGVANRFGNEIEIHEDLFLPQNVYLFNPILEHEISHSSVNKWTWKDFWLDFFPKRGLSYFSLLKFMVLRPNTWVQLSPFYYHHDRQGWVYDINLLVIYTIYFLLTFMFIVVNRAGLL